MSHESLYSVRILSTDYESLASLSHALGRPIAEHICIGTENWMEQFPDAIVPVNIQDETYANFGPNIVHGHDVDSKLVAVRMSDRSLDWHKQFKVHDFYDRVRFSGGIPEGQSTQELHSFIQSLPKSKLPLGTIIRAGIADEIAQCEQPDFAEKLHTAQVQRELFVTSLLTQRRRYHLRSSY